MAIERERRSGTYVLRHASAFDSTILPSLLCAVARRSRAHRRPRTEVLDPKNSAVAAASSARAVTGWNDRILCRLRYAAASKAGRVKASCPLLFGRITERKTPLWIVDL